MSYNDDLPTWGATGSKPFDGTSRSPGDNIPASEYNYLWYILNETFGEIDTDLNNIEQGGVADDPHGNDAHDPDFLAQTDYDPEGDIDFSQLLLNNPHGNEAHTEDYITSGEVDGGAPDPHGNSSHSTNYLAQTDYNPVSDVEAKTSALNIDIGGDADTVDGQDASAFADATHGNEAHSEDYITSAEVDGGAPDPHGNSAHTVTFAVDGVEQPPENHGNEAHTEDYITSGEIDGGAPDPHGNSSHSTNYLPSNNYNPVSDVEAETTPLNIDITGDADTVDGQDASAFADAPHGSEAHRDDYIQLTKEVDVSAYEPYDLDALQQALDDYRDGTIELRALLAVIAFYNGSKNPPADGIVNQDFNAAGITDNDMVVADGITSYDSLVGDESLIEHDIVKNNVVFDKKMVGKDRIKVEGSIGGLAVAEFVHDGNTIAKLQPNGNLNIAGTVTENATF